MWESGAENKRNWILKSRFTAGKDQNLLSEQKGRLRGWRPRRQVRQGGSPWGGVGGRGRGRESRVDTLGSLWLQPCQGGG